MTNRRKNSRFIAKILPNAATKSAFRQNPRLILIVLTRFGNPTMGQLALKRQAPFSTHLALFRSYPNDLRP